MTVCAAYGCSSRSEKKQKGITFHRFPKDVKRRQQWTLAVKRANWLPSKNSQLCSKHFAEEMFDRTSRVVVRLKLEAVPTIFEGLPSHEKQELDYLTPKADLKTPYPLNVKQEPFEVISNDTHIQTALFGGSDKNRILVVPGDLDILSTFYSNNKNNNNQNHVLIIPDDPDIKKMLNNENVDDSDDNRAIIVSVGTNVQSEWCVNIEEDRFLYGMVTLDDTNIGMETLNNSFADSSYKNPLLLHKSEFYIKRLKELEEEMVEVKKKLKISQQTSRRNIGKIIKLKKEVSRINRNSQPRPCSAKPIVHLITCDHC